MPRTAPCSTASDGSGRLLGDKSGLTLDPEIDSYHLTSVLVNSLPGIIEGLAHVGGRGAAYIDTGLFEAGAADSLQRQAQHLRQAVSVFKLEGNAGSGAPEMGAAPQPETSLILLRGPHEANGPADRPPQMQRRA
jgi:hypothetical protein